MYKIKIIINKFPSSSREYFNILRLCNREEDISSKAFYENATDYDWTDFTRFIYKSTQLCESLILKCVFGGLETNCSSMFVPVLTDEGMCCTYNTVDSYYMFTREAKTRINDTRLRTLEPVDWTTEEGYPPDAPPNHFPQEAVGPGESCGLSIVVDANVDDYFCSSTNVAGFKVILHNPTETPAIKELGLYLAPGQETKFLIQVQKLDSTPEIKDIAVDRRKCAFDSEGGLLFYETYSKQNCEMECQAAKYIEYCGCIEHYMPRIYTNASLCGLKDLTCTGIINFFAESNSQTCAEKCLPGCFELTYTPISFSVPFSVSRVGVKDQFLNKFSKDYIIKNLAIFHFYYKDYSFQSYIQSQYIGVTEFLCEIYFYLNFYRFLFLLYFLQQILAV